MHHIVKDIQQFTNNFAYEKNRTSFLMLDSVVLLILRFYINKLKVYFSLQPSIFSTIDWMLFIHPTSACILFNKQIILQNAC